MKDIKVRPKVIISACLGFRACRYNGDKINFPFLSKMEKYVDFVAVCPEADCGMGIPRKTVRLVNVNDELKMLQPATGKDWTDSISDLIEEVINNNRDADGFILKAKSPTCGIKGVKIYHDIEGKRPVSRGAGLFTAKLKEEFPYCAMEDEGRLLNYNIRESFLIQLFTFARYRTVQNIENLVDFHSTHKLLFLGFNQAAMRRMGRLVANHDKLDFKGVKDQYKAELDIMFSQPLKANSMINVLQHGLSGFKDLLSSEEKKFFIEILEDYRDERVPLSVPLNILKSWSIQYNNSYLMNQIVMEPYPKELTEISDSGKGRDLKK